jgi:radical SAM superfamily enzyme YgiQ (UPF0313 family)
MNAVAEYSPPLGLLYLASYLRRETRTEIRLLDLACRTMSAGQVADEARAFRPDFVGVSALCLQAPAVQKLAGAIRTALPDVPIVLGGAYGTTQPHDAFRSLPIDFCVVGEGERVLANWVRTLAEGGDWSAVRGLAYRRDGNVVVNPREDPIDNPDALPFPAFDLADFEACARLPRLGSVCSHRRYFPVFSSRGCPFSCSFCHPVFGKRYRARSPENVLGEVDLLVREHGVREILFFDDCFNLQRDRVIAICRGLLERKYGAAVSFPNGLRADLLDEEVIDWLKRAGTYKVAVAIETADPHLQRRIGKNLDLERASRAIDLLARRRIIAHGFFMFGFPDETRQEMAATTRFACRSRLHSASFFFVQPLPGSGLCHVFRQRGMPLPDNAHLTNYFDRRMAQYTLADATPRQIRQRIRLTALRFYANPLRLGRLLRDMPNRRQLLYLAWVTFIRLVAPRSEAALIRRQVRAAARA